MILDFSLIQYKKLIQIFKSSDYKFKTVENFFSKPESKVIIFRHDVDRKPLNSLNTAIIENKLGIKASYYFRILKNSNNEITLRKIAKLGHEIGYHYENLSFISNKYWKSILKNHNDSKNYLLDLAIKDFEKKLNHLRKYYPIKTIAMHGNPTSKCDSRNMWKKFKYQDFGIICEPYIDFDYNEILYITDTGRSWNNNKINRWDKVESKFDYSFNHTNEIIKMIEQNKLPNRIIMNIHPEHWSNSKLEWHFIYFSRKIKNILKFLILKKIENIYPTI